MISGLKYKPVQAILIVAFLLAGGCRPGPAAPPDAEPDVPPEKMGEQRLALLHIMQSLATHLNRVQTGIVTNNRYLIEDGARAIYKHPAPEGGLAPFLVGKKDFPENQLPVFDRMVHQIARQISESASDQDLSTLQSLYNQMTGACINCHKLFRD